MIAISRLRIFALALLGWLVAPSPANAEMILSQVIVDLVPDKPSREDIEVWNSGDERMYVSAEPFEIRNPGTPEEQRVSAVDAEQSGILISPQKLILEPGERRIIRIAAVSARPETDRVYRVAIKPVGGPVTAETSALKVFVGYDALVIYRSEQVSGSIEITRMGQTLTLENRSNRAQEIFDGQQCSANGVGCQSLPAKRLYPGAKWTQTLPFETPASYKAAHGAGVAELRF